MKRFTLILIVVVISLVSVAAVGAQAPDGDRQNRRGNGFFGDTLEELGITAEDVQAAAEAGDTWADLITANGGDVAAIQAEAVATFTENSDRDAADIEERIENRLNSVVGENRGERGDRGERGERGELFSTVTDALGVDAEAFRDAFQAAGDDATVAQVIESLGGDVDAIAANVAAQISERTDGDVDEIQAQLIERWNTPRSERPASTQGDNA